MGFGENVFFFLRFLKFQTRFVVVSSSFAGIRVNRTPPLRTGTGQNLFFFSFSSRQFVVEQHDATGRRQVGDFDGPHHERFRVSDGREPVHIHGEQFGAVGPSEQQNRTRVVVVRP